jgi:protein-tyrosine phosphatase
VSAVNDLFWIKGLAGESAPNLAIVLRPRGDDWLETELIRMKQRGIDTVVSLLEPEEADMLGLTEEQALAEKIGMQFLSFPIPDTHVPSDTAAFRGFVSGLADRAHTGERIGIHCRGSIGRATVTAACTLAHLGWKPRAALEAVETARGCAVPDTQEQQGWILRYEAQP